MDAWNFPARLDGLRSQAQLRQRRVVASPSGAHLAIAGRDLLAFASNDYLGLAADARIIAAARDAATRLGVGSGASHLLSGHTAAHAALEERLAAFSRCERTLTFSTGYLANLAILSSLGDRQSEIFADKLNHACLNDGAQLSRARFTRYAHLDLAQLERLLAASPSPRKIIATDAVFSMDGDIAPLPALLALAEQHGALLVVDDAHGFGVLGPQGRGTVAHFGLTSPALVYMATLGKAAGVAGAFVAGRADLVEWIMQSARSYLFSTAAPALLAEAALASLDIIEHDAARRAHLGDLIAYFRRVFKPGRWTLSPSETAIQPLIIGASDTALAAADSLYERGIWAPVIRPPTVAPGTARLRISLTAAHSHADVDRLVEALHDVQGSQR